MQQKVQWTSSVGVLEEEEKLEVAKVDNLTFENVLKGNWIQNELYEKLISNNFKLLLVNDDGERKAIRTFGARFALFTGIVTSN
jgi:hypothetical protein